MWRSQNQQAVHHLDNNVCEGRGGGGYRFVLTFCGCGAVKTNKASMTDACAAAAMLVIQGTAA